MGPQTIFRNEAACLAVDRMQGANCQLPFDGNHKDLLPAVHADPHDLRVTAPYGHDLETEPMEHPQDLSRTESL